MGLALVGVEAWWIYSFTDFVMGFVTMGFGAVEEGNKGERLSVDNMNFIWYI